MYKWADVDGETWLMPVEKTIVSLTRIEPPLHPDGPEKVLQDFGIEPEEFDEEGLLEHINTRQRAVKQQKVYLHLGQFIKKILLKSSQRFIVL